VQLQPLHVQLLRLMDVSDLQSAAHLRLLLLLPLPQLVQEQTHMLPALMPWVLLLLMQQQLWLLVVKHRLLPLLHHPAACHIPGQLYAAAPACLYPGNPASLLLLHIGCPQFPDCRQCQLQQQHASQLHQALLLLLLLNPRHHPPQASCCAWCLSPNTHRHQRYCQLALAWLAQHHLAAAAPVATA
jgi:hypothetical protein